jgi:tRNA A-37 threonylcarbamoyl transferase component Bud32
MRRIQAPFGYDRIDHGGSTIVARADAAPSIIAALRGAPSDNPTLHGYASRAPGAHRFHGREIAYGVILPGLPFPVVVRHNRHGGTFRDLTGDLFLGATRAPRELAISLALKSAGIPTPQVIAYAVYPAGSIFARSDVVTEEILNSRDLGDVLLHSAFGSGERLRALGATSRLLKRLSAAGVRHHDLNVKNVLIPSVRDDLAVAYVLDVDRIELDCTRRDAYAGNRARLRRSIDKWRRTRGAVIDDGELPFLRSTYLADTATTSS